jgi:phosphoribosylformylglycinamidine synthase PurS subunit|tara:strand:- start:954 stop:1199 length:246 start_codon:yes stop_codon:yes gene_type:complete
LIYSYEVKILYKDNVNDPQGLTITESAKRIGFEGIISIRSGKIFIVDIESDSEKSSSKTIDKISDKLLSNPIIEKFSYKKI